MASGTITLVRTGSGYLTGQILWSSQSNGAEANTSTVTAQLQIQRSAQSSTTGTFKGTFTVGSTSETISWYGTLPSYEWVTIKTITATISHNADGNGSCYLYALINGPTQTTMEGTYVRGSSTVTLDWIPRYASLISVTNFSDIENPVITYSNPAGTAVSALRACISLDGTTVNIAYRDLPVNGTRYTFSLTEDERNTLRRATANNNALRVYVVMRTIIGDNSDFKTATAVMNIVNAQPTISPTIVDTNAETIAVTGNSSILVALHSTANVTINASGKKYATIKSQKVEHGTVTLTGDGTLSVTNNPIKISVIDSRNNLTVRNASNTIVPYINPTCLIGNNLPETDGSFSLKATGLFYNGSIGKTTNTLTVQYRYKSAGGSYGSWTAFSSVTKNGNSYTATANLSGFDYQTVYTIQARVIDSLHASGVYAADKAVIAEPVFDWGESDFRFNVPVNLKDGCEIRKNGATAYAPYGFGLGMGSTSKAVKSITANGWYITNVDTPSSTWLLCHARVTNNGSDITVDAWNLSGTAKYKITKRNGTWGEWENEFPLMTVGKEYRTTERHNGKTVWTVLADLNTCPSGETTVNTSFAATGVVRWDGNDCIYESARNDKYLRTKRVSIVSGKLAITNIFGTQVGSSHEYCRIWYTKA